jgi:hypothetical protein
MPGATSKYLHPPMHVLYATFQLHSIWPFGLMQYQIHNFPFLFKLL